MVSVIDKPKLGAKGKDFGVVDQLCKFIESKATPEQSASLNIFVKDFFYKNISEEDLIDRSLVDLYGAALSHFKLLKILKPNEVKIRIFNPSVKQDGWKSDHTIIELVQKDQPFLVDSLRMVLSEMDLNIHLIIQSGSLRNTRDAQGRLTYMAPRGGQTQGQFQREAVVYIEVDRQQDDTKVLNKIEKSLRHVIEDIHYAVADYEPMKIQLMKMSQSLHEMSQASEHNHKLSKDLEEMVAFLNWLGDDHFIFMGYSEFYASSNASDLKEYLPDYERCLGVLKQKKRYPLSGALNFHYKQNSTDSKTPSLTPIKADLVSTIHRPAPIDIVVISMGGNDARHYCFWGLYTSEAYHSSPKSIPFLRQKYQQVILRSEMLPTGHAGKSLGNVLENFPRDLLFQLDFDKLYETAMGMQQLQDRLKLKLFICPEPYSRYYFCMVYVPRDLYNTDLRIKMQGILMHELRGREVSFKPNFLSSGLCRIDFIVKVDPKDNQLFYSVKDIEAKLVLAARSWGDDLKVALNDFFGEHQATILHAKYLRAFPEGYKEIFLARSAANDIEFIEQVIKGQEIGMFFYRMLEEADDRIRFKLFQKEQAIPLTQVLPILENMGLRVIEERPYQMKIDTKMAVWISDFGMQVTESVVELDSIRENFQQTFDKIWKGQIENDGFNALVVIAGLTWNEIIILRAYAKYMLQVGLLYPESYIIKTLCDLPKLSMALIQLFKTRFDPTYIGHREKACAKIISNIRHMLNDVQTIDQDKIIRRFISLIMATIRTSYFQTIKGQPKSNIAFKIHSSLIPQMPSPVPLYEIYVYSPRVEGVHLRAAKVARGGIRYSERASDFRTEVLGLMKAQQVKNAVIVPLGAKGGFIAKIIPNDKNDRSQAMEVAKQCYQEFIQSLLDVTDNIIQGKIVHPKDVVIYDDADPYLVVAADRGTATFSDLANYLAKKYQFWLGDAFASGGEFGYDHKKMGITARGTWESIKRHMMRMQKNIKTDLFTVVAIGDMSGDVFGNGMIYSDRIQLVAAFNHRHIFIDPKPNPKISYQERVRLFNSGLQWGSYDVTKLSPGGGIYERSAKQIKLSKEAMQALGIRKETHEPNDLLKLILRARVDLLFNGGIGTFVRASDESDSEVGDRSNDLIRIEASELKARSVGEGGNLGLTQKARIEYALNGGLIFTDAIDNSAGVDCSDHEVNIKVLLEMAVSQGDLTVVERNELLKKMDNDVAKLVLRNNYEQTGAITHMLNLGGDHLGLTLRLMREMEREGHLKRELEYLPSNKQLKVRATNNQGLTMPEVSVLMAYSKTVIKKELLASSLPDQSYCQQYLEGEFPPILRKKYGKLMQGHPLAREIVVTVLTNKVFRFMGITFVQRLYDETGAKANLIVAAFLTSIECFDIEKIWSDIEKLDGQIPVSLQSSMMYKVSKLIRRITRWLLRDRRSGIDMASEIKLLRPKVRKIRSGLRNYFGKEELKSMTQYEQSLIEAGVPSKVALQVSEFLYMYPLMDIITLSTQHNHSLHAGAEIYFALNEKLSFAWFRNALFKVKQEGYWGVLASSGLRDDLDKLQRLFTLSILNSTSSHLAPLERIEQWVDRYHRMVKRWEDRVSDLKTTSQDFVVYIVAIRGLLDLAQVCLKSSGEDHAVE